jgi:hypothetical protein
LFLECEVGIACLACFGLFNEDTGDKPLLRFLAGEEPNNPIAFLDLAVDLFEAIGGLQRFSLGLREGEESKAIWSPSAQALSLGCVSE